LPTSEREKDLSRFGVYR